MICVNTSGDGPMKNRAIAIIMVVAAFGSDYCLPAFAQNAIGGVKKQSAIGGPVKPITLGGPAKPISPAGPAKPNLVKPNLVKPNLVQPGLVQPSPIGGAVKPGSPVVPVNKSGAAAVAPSLSKCRAPCVAKRSR